VNSPRLRIGDAGWHCGFESHALRYNLIAIIDPNRDRPNVAQRKRKEKTKPTPPAEDVVEKIDKSHTDDDFLRDLRKATTDEARKKLGLPSGRGRE
jgi:hypothetical protein